jgi:UDP-N-acetylmuramoylalanine--D-glutamate ligase
LASHPESEAIKKVLTTFTGLEYRIEKVREVDSISYYNDSFGTTPETAIVAIESIESPKTLILGGSDKGSDYTELGQVIAKGNIRHIILIGAMADKIETAITQKLGSHSKVAITKLGSEATMEEIVEKARQASKPGDAVLLSPACASFDMFKNYKDRGDQFNRAVQALV